MIDVPPRFNAECARGALASDAFAVRCFAVWADLPQGHDYWQAIQEAMEHHGASLPDEARAYIEQLLAAHAEIA